MAARLAALPRGFADHVRPELLLRPPHVPILGVIGACVLKPEVLVSGASRGEPVGQGHRDLAVSSLVRAGAFVCLYSPPSSLKAFDPTLTQPD